MRCLLEKLVDAKTISGNNATLHERRNEEQPGRWRSGRDTNQEATYRGTR